MNNSRTRLSRFHLLQGTSGMLHITLADDGRDYDAVAAARAEAMADAA